MKRVFRSILASVLSVVLGVTAGITAIPQLAIDSNAEYYDREPIQVVNDGYVHRFNGFLQDRIWFGSYMQGKDENGEYITEPIEWKNVEYKDGQLYLLSSKNLDVIRYNDEASEVSYRDSSIRAWLNGSLDGQFLKTAFTEQEQAVIADTPVGKDDDGDVIFDKIFLISGDDKTNPEYLFSKNATGDTDEEYSMIYRSATNTAYVADGGSLGTDSMAAEGETDSWWLRSSSDGKYASVVDEKGTFVKDSVAVDDPATAVRPALKIDLSDVLLVSESSELSKQCGPVGPDTLDSPKYYYDGNAWKLTVLDHDRDFSATRVGEGDVEAGSRITIDYSGATLGENEYVSVILQDSMGNFLSYGRITDNSVSGAEESGTAELTIPSDLAGQDVVVKVYSEQVNSEHMTDYASAFSTIDIRVKPDESIDTSSLDIAWYNVEGKSYWYENGVRQGTYEDEKGVLGEDPETGLATNRGREIYDPKTRGWYWLDSCYDGAKAMNKEVWIPYVFQDEADWSDEEIDRNAAAADFGMEGMGERVRDAIKNKEGKWVRYDSYGRMMKGWVTIEGPLKELYPEQAGNTYYYDRHTGLMAKGWVYMNYHNYHFDETTGVLLEQSEYLGPR